MSITLEQLLESVSDAVSALVLFAAEASNNTAVLKNLTAGAQGVQAAVNYLASQAEATVAKWKDLGSDEMAAKMQASIDGLRTCVKAIADACIGIQKDPSNPAPKAAILDEGKDLMKWMVSLLQFNDLYDVMVALKQVCNEIRLEEVLSFFIFYLLLSLLLLLSRSMFLLFFSKSEIWLV